MAATIPPVLPVDKLASPERRVALAEANPPLRRMPLMIREQRGDALPSPPPVRKTPTDSLDVVNEFSFSKEPRQQQPEDHAAVRSYFFMEGDAAPAPHDHDEEKKVGSNYTLTPQVVVTPDPMITPPPTPPPGPAVPSRAVTKPNMTLTGPLVGGERRGSEDTNPALRKSPVVPRRQSETSSKPTPESVPQPIQN